MSSAKKIAGVRLRASARNRETRAGRDGGRDGGGSGVGGAVGGGNLWPPPPASPQKGNVTRCWSLFLSLSCVALSFLLSLAHSLRPPLFLSVSFLLSLSLSLPLVVLVCGFAYLPCVDSKGLILLVMLGRRSGSAACRW